MQYAVLNYLYTCQATVKFCKFLKFLFKTKQKKIFSTITVHKTEIGYNQECHFQIFISVENLFKMCEL